MTKHVNSSPPRKYTFDEWAWYLKLIGEDESDSDKHRRAKRNMRTGEAAKDGVGRGKKEKWSWIDERSPLMGNTEEAEVSTVSPLAFDALSCYGRESFSSWALSYGNNTVLTF